MTVSSPNPPPAAHPDEGSPAGRFVGCLVTVLGGLMTVLCGACTAVFLTIGLSAPRGGAGDYGITVMSLVIGGIPTLVGVSIFIAGILILRASRRPPH